MDNTARRIEEPAPAYELMYRAIGGEVVLGQEILATLGADIERGHIVGPQTILTLVFENDLISSGEIQSVVDVLNKGIARHAGDKEVTQKYRAALRQCEKELERRAGQKVVTMRR